MKTLLDKLDKGRDLIKHSATIHIKTELSFAERKVMNLLLKNAHEDLGKQTRHVVRLSELQKAMGWTYSNDKDIKKYLDRLVSTSIKWNILGKDKKNEWGITTLLASAVIKSGYCEYAYSPALVDKLSNPNIYARINLYTQKEFSKKYALILWEFIIEHICTTKDTQNSQLKVDISLEKLRDLLSIEQDKYTEFKILKRNILIPAIEEINKIANIVVQLDSKRTGRKISSIKFIILRKSEAELENLEEEAKIVKLLQDKFNLSISYIENKKNGIMRLLSSALGKEIIYNAMEATREYIKEKKEKGDHTIPAAIIKKAIEGEWRPKDLLYKVPQKTSVIEEGREGWRISKQDKEQQNFKNFLGMIKHEVGEDAYNSWFLINLESVDDAIVFEAKNRFMKEWVENNYDAVIQKYCHEIFSNKDYKFIVKDN